MIALHLTHEDITRIRFAFSPMVEAVTSFHMLSKYPHPSQYMEWIDEASRAYKVLTCPT